MLTKDISTIWQTKMSGRLGDHAVGGRLGDLIVDASQFVFCDLHPSWGDGDGHLAGRVGDHFANLVVGGHLGDIPVGDLHVGDLRVGDRLDSYVILCVQI
jgi:hypothetical protein